MIIKLLILVLLTACSTQKIDIASLHGVYVGSEQCSNCKSVEVRLALYSNNRFDLVKNYIGSEPPNIEKYSGNYEYNISTSKLKLNRLPNINEQIFSYIVEDSKLKYDEEKSKYLYKSFPSSLIEKPWHLQSIAGSSNQIDFSSILNFDLFGNVTIETENCNYFGSYRITNENIEFHKIRITKLNRTTNNTDLEYLLKKSSKYKIEDRLLYLIDSEGKKIMTFSNN